MVSEALAPKSEILYSVRAEEFLQAEKNPNANMTNEYMNSFRFMVIGYNYG